MPNRLAKETSPYLLQHTDNPVAWHPWDDTALALSVKLDKPILLSIGYAACHWCHVMAHECFENDEIAAVMNAHFVCIKVDREERPDLDKIYQTAHQMLTERPGGWPLTMVLTPGSHAPFFAGTYIPPVANHGMPAFAEVLDKISAHYVENKDHMKGHVTSFQKVLNQLNPVGNNNVALNIEDCLDQSIDRLQEQFDAENGGFGSAPKFPHPTQLELLLRHGYSKQAPVDVGIAMANKTFRRMVQGGLFDQLVGGFYRYSVDKEWCIPHFEKMLYDNAQLIGLYADGYGLTGHNFYEGAVRETANWVISEMQQAHGGYASTLDADSECIEGKFYVWNEIDLRAILTEDEYGAVEYHFGLYGEPNFEGAWHFNINQEADVEGYDEAFNKHLDAALNKLRETRAERIRPGLDDKILTSWNGLMIKGMARAGARLNMPKLIHSAQQSADFIRAHCWVDGHLLATYREQQARLNGYLDDYAFLAEGLIELLQCSWRADDFNLLVTVVEAMLAKFEDTEHGGFYFTSHDHEQLLYRPKPGADDAIPSSNGAATSVLYRLGVLLGEPRYIESAKRTIDLYGEHIQKHPSVYASLALAGLDARETNTTVVIRGSRKNMEPWVEELAHQYMPDIWVYPIPEEEIALPESLALKAAMKGKTVAYICRGMTCSEPVDSLEALKEVLNS